MKSVVITGVSTGIGWGSTKVLVGKGYHVFGSVRRQQDADRLTAEFGDDRFTPLLFDVTDEPAVRAAAGQVREHLAGETLFGLVNNAGVALAGPLLHQSTDEFRRQLEVNLVGAHIVTRAFAPLLGADRTLRGNPGRIVNISSVGGQMAPPFLGAYAASKHGLEGYSESLRRELLLYGIDVILIGPGAVATPIWDKAEEADLSAYEGTDYAAAIRTFRDYFIHDGRLGVSPETVGAVVWTALTAPHPHVRYAVLRQRFLNWTLPRLLPKRFLDRQIGKKTSLLPKR